MSIESSFCRSKPVLRLSGCEFFQPGALRRCHSSSLLQAASDSDLEPIAYEFFTQAFVLYEEDISVRLTASNMCYACRRGMGSMSVR